MFSHIASIINKKHITETISSNQFKKAFKSIKHLGSDSENAR